MVKEYFAKAERGPEVLAKFDGCEILLNIPKVGVPEHTSWVTNGWELSSLVLPRVRLSDMRPGVQSCQLISRPSWLQTAF